MISIKRIIKKLPSMVYVILIVLILAIIQGSTNNYYISIGCLLVFIMGFPLYRLVKERDQVMNMIRYIEGMMFGKPLDKELWKPGEKHKVKTKFVWRKKKNE